MPKLIHNLISALSNPCFSGVKVLLLSKTSSEPHLDWSPTRRTVVHPLLLMKHIAIFTKNLMRTWKENHRYVLCHAHHALPLLLHLSSPRYVLKYWQPLKDIGNRVPLQSWGTLAVCGDTAIAPIDSPPKCSYS